MRVIKFLLNIRRLDAHRLPVVLFNEAIKNPLNCKWLISFKNVCSKHNIIEVWEFLIENRGQLDLDQTKLKLLEFSLQADLERINNSTMFNYYNALVDPTAPAYCLNIGLPIQQVRMLFSLRVNSPSYYTKYGVLKLNPENTCTFCNLYQPFTCF